MAHGGAGTRYRSALRSCLAALEGNETTATAQHLPPRGGGAGLALSVRSRAVIFRIALLRGVETCRSRPAWLGGGARQLGRSRYFWVRRGEIHGDPAQSARPTRAMNMLETMRMSKAVI
jgi:hypothetical protein